MNESILNKIAQLQKSATGSINAPGTEAALPPLNKTISLGDEWIRADRPLQRGLQSLLAGQKETTTDQLPSVLDGLLNSEKGSTMAQLPGAATEMFKSPRGRMLVAMMGVTALAGAYAARQARNKPAVE